MTPTEQVRSKLDAHGVEWRAGYGFSNLLTNTKTREGNTIEIIERMDGSFEVYDLTPEQASKIGVFLA